jgi:CHAT domain-containing protein/Tfp pilus assembly protein PilF
VISLGVPLLLASLAVQSSSADSLRALAVSISDNALAVEIRARPLAVRDAVTDALRRSDTAIARRLAEAYAAAWDDSFLVREVARFASWPAQRQATKVWVDSVRRAGIAAYGRDGPAAALRIWRRALARTTAIDDSAGRAAVLGNIGAGFLAEGQLDSARLLLERARRLAVAVGDRRVEANAVGMLAGVSEERGDWATAQTFYGQALALRKRIGDTRGVAADYNNLGLLAQRLGDTEEARRQFEGALSLNRNEGRDEVAATNLVNLAGLASLSGDFGRADAQYRDALAIWQAHEAWADAAAAWHGLGQVDIRRGAYPAAQSALREALSVYERTGPVSAELAVRRDLAGALAAAGDLQGARDELTRAQRRADSTRAPPAARAGITLARAHLAFEFNALAEAQRLYARAEALYRVAAEPGGEADAQEGRGLLLLARDDAVRAQGLLEAALRTHVGAGNRRGAGLTRVSLAQALLQRGDTTGARRHLARATAELDRSGDPVAAAAAAGEWAALEARAGRTMAADSLYRAAIARLGDRAAPAVAWRLHAGWAVVLRGQGARDAAARELRIALRELERPSRSLALPERRSAFLADKWEVYAQLAFVERDRGRVGAAFEASERLRAREMLELLARGRISTPTATAEDIVAREQDLRRRIAELTHEVESGATVDQTLRGSDEALGVGGATGAALLRAQEAYADVLLEARERAPRHAALVAPDAATWQSVAGRLTPGAAFIEYLVSDSAALAFVVTADTIAVVNLDTRRRDLARLVEFARGALTPRASDSLWRGALRQLHQRLIAPIEEAGLLSQKTRLVIVPHAELNYLPFAALLGGEGSGRFLVERYELATTPSASVWLALGDRRRDNATGGVLAFAPNPGALPGSRQEVATVQRLAGDARVLIGASATEDAFRREGPTRRVLHLASYGVLNKQNPLFSFVELAPGGTNDGRLEVHEVLGLSFAADLVVLSACQTALGSGALTDVPAGDDWIGLTRAFLHAGAASVVATLWPVDDWATAALMEQFYTVSDAPANPAGALAGAQRAILAAPTTAHPFYWAGFVAVGGANVGGIAP